MALLFCCRSILGTPEPKGSGGLVWSLGEHGLENLRFNGEPLVASPRHGDLELAKPFLRAALQSLLQTAPSTARRMASDSDTVELPVPWGRVSATYRGSGNTLTIEVRVINTGSEKIDELPIRLCELTFPEIPNGKMFEAGMFGLGFKGTSRPLHEYPHVADPVFVTPVIGLEFSKAVIAFCADDLRATPAVPFATDVLSKKSYPLVATARDIAPGATETFQVSLRFAPPETQLPALAGDVVDRYREKYPARLNWPDRRPIGMIYLASSGIGHVSNPRRWIMDSGRLDVSGTEGKTRFRAALLELADRSIKILKELGGQGMVTWDPEGQEFMQSVYYGDPRLTPTLAPETDFRGDGSIGAMDEYFARFREAGLKVGVCLRPQQITMQDGKPVQGVADNAHAAAVLKAKLAYAKDRWGCTLFYVDSTVDGKHQPLDPAVFEELTKAFPDTLVMPENESLRYFATTAPLNSYVHHRVTATPAGARAVYPQAFSVLMAPDGDRPEDHAALVSAIRQGDILLFNCWYRTDGLDGVKALYREAAGDKTAHP